jgi:hypothetical protein
MPRYAETTMTHTSRDSATPGRDLTTAPLNVITLGVDMFADALAEQGVPLVRVDWRPPMAVAEKAFDLLPLLED